MPYFLGGVIDERKKLAGQTPEAMGALLKADVRTRAEVFAINPSAKEVKVRELKSGREYVEPYDELVLSVGAKPVRPPIPGIDRPGNFTLRGLDDMDEINKWIGGGSGAPVKSAVVAGGGYIGRESLAPSRAARRKSGAAVD